MAKPIIICQKCKKEKTHHAKGMCCKCYKKRYNQPYILCKTCKKQKPHHAFGLCSNCYIKTHKYDQIKAHNYKKWHNISLENYREITEKCLVCGFDKIVELHHLDKDHNNNSSNNLIGLCPNHHKMLHTDEYCTEIKEMMENKLNFGKSET